MGWGRDGEIVADGEDGGCKFPLRVGEAEGICTGMRLGDVCRGYGRDLDGERERGRDRVGETKERAGDERGWLLRTLESVWLGERSDGEFEEWLRSEEEGTEKALKTLLKVGED